MAKQPVASSTTPAALSLSEIKQLAKTNPREALELLELRKRLAEEESEEEKRAQFARAQLTQLQAVQELIEETLERQANCAHRVDRDTSAIGGQRGGDHRERMICIRCHDTWIGIGNGMNPDGTKQLPPHLAAQVNWEHVGGITSRG